MASSSNSFPIPAVNWSSPLHRVLTGHSNGINSVSITGDGSRIASCAESVVRIWDTESATLIRELAASKDKFYTADITWDGSRIAAAGLNKKIVVWNTQAGQLILKIKGHTYWIQSIAFSRDGTKLVSGCEKSVRVWDANTGEELRLLEDTASGIRVPLFSEMYTARSVTFSSDNVHVASGGTDKLVKVWNVTSGYCAAVLKGHTDWIASVAFSADEKKVLSGSWDDTIRIWDWTAGTCILTFHSSATARAITVTRDGTLAASPSRNDIVLWRIDTGVIVHRLEGHTRSVKRVAFLPDGTGLVSGSDDKTLRIWKARINQVSSNNFQSQQSIDHNVMATYHHPTGAHRNGSEPSVPSTPHSHVLRSQPRSTSTYSTSPSARSFAPVSSHTIPGMVVVPLQANRDALDILPRSPHLSVHSNIPQSTSASPSSSGRGLPVARRNLGVDPDTVTRQADLVDERLDTFISFVQAFTGKYRRRSTEPCGGGAFSDVWICDAKFIDNTLRTVAEKRLRTVMIDQVDRDGVSVLKRMIQRLQREIHVWSKLKHPYIVPLIGFRIEPSTCLISPWYSNGHVRNWVKRHPEVDRQKLMRQAANGMTHLHSMDPPIIHGDIKADNVLVDDGGNAVINDFGLSQIIEDTSPGFTITSTGAVGNARWLAPEIVSGDLMRSKASDVYAFGCLLLEIATGALPFKDLKDNQIPSALERRQTPGSNRALYPELRGNDTLWLLIYVVNWTCQIPQLRYLILGRATRIKQYTVMDTPITHALIILILILNFGSIITSAFHFDHMSKPGVLSAFTNQSIDDFDSAFSYSPEDVWHGNGCPSCLADPDPYKLYRHTWHEVSRPVDILVPFNAKLVFKGVAIFVYSASSSTAGVNTTFTIDGIIAGRFTRPPVSNNFGTWLYDEIVFNSTELTDDSHTLMITVEPGAFFVLDRVDVTTLTALNDTESEQLSSKKGAIAGGTVGGVVGLIIILPIIIIVYLFRNEVKTKMKRWSVWRVTKQAGDTPLRPLPET
ncbi:hypothetical protein FRC03_001146 [Tulasnella sp. 419]|nr:hypothetical protein FRC03_001146 [Tulasnella sp. 419]